jgi:hypothetical protein
MFGSLLFLPWWFTVIAAIAFLAYFNAYEILFWGLFGDFLYSASVTEFFNFQFIFVSLFTLLFIGAYFLKKRLIFYNV